MDEPRRDEKSDVLRRGWWMSRGVFVPERVVRERDIAALMELGIEHMTRRD